MSGCSLDYVAAVGERVSISLPRVVLPHGVSLCPCARWYDVVVLRSVHTRRFLKYSFVGVSTFLFDLGLLFVCIDVLHWHYLLATPVAYTIAVSLNYLASRRLVFAGTARGMRTGYVIFLLISLSGMGFVTLGMYLLITHTSVSYFGARVCVASLAGIWNYLMNLFVNFKVAAVSSIED